MRIIGITGGIGGGKSAVTDYLLDKGFTVVDADVIAREVVAAGTDGLAAVVRRFGEDVLSRDGGLDRKRLAALVFSDDGARADLEAILHGRIGSAIGDRIEVCRAAREKVVFLSAPLLIETGMHALADEVWLVDADEEERARRVVLRDGLSPDEARARMAAQAPSSEKARHASEIIDNSGTIRDLRRAVDGLLDKYGI
jgi:dephospho-CoA kinase